jgi:hypothetical protein
MKDIAFWLQSTIMKDRDFWLKSTSLKDSIMVAVDQYEGYSLLVEVD